jgi:hypothetical protein
MEFYPERELPECYWLKIEQNAGSDDFGINDQYRLVVPVLRWNCYKASVLIIVT